MDDLISRQAAIQHLKKRLYETALNNITEHPYYEEMADNRVDVWLNEIPSAERRGKKKVFYHGENTFSYVCDQCAMPIDGKDAFCRWCGAKMEV